MEEVTLRVDSGYIQWKYASDETWQNLIDLITLKGPSGTDGLEVLLRVEGDYLQWKYEGELTWNNMYNISSLEGLGIQELLINELGELIITYTDATIVNLGELSNLNLVQFLGINGYVINVQYVRDNQGATAPTVPVVEGYTFLNWSVDFSNVTTELTVLAIYSINSYTIAFNSEGGNSLDPLVLPYETSLDLPIPVKSGYTFLGWYDGNHANSRHIVNGDLVNKDLFLYARWQRNTSISVSNVSELNKALANGSYDEIIFANDITIYQQIEVYRPVTINGNGYKLFTYNYENSISINNSKVSNTFESSYPTNSYLTIRDLDVIFLNNILPGTEASSFIEMSDVLDYNLNLINVNISGNAGYGLFNF